MYEKFEDWPNVQKIQFISAFVNEFNKINKALFKVGKDSLEADQDFDFSFQKGEDKLKVQHTYMYREQKEYVKDKTIIELIDQTNSNLAGLEGIYIWVNFNKLPVSKEDKRKLIYFLSDFIKLKVREGNNTLYNYHIKDETYLKIIKQWVDWLEIKRFNHPRFVLAYGSHNYNDCLITPDDNRIRTTLIKKEKYSKPDDLILLIHNNSRFPIETIFFDSILEECKDKKFMQIWLYDEMDERFYKLK